MTISSDDKIKTAMDLVVFMVVEQLAKNNNTTAEAELYNFLLSKTAQNVYDNSLKIWAEGPDSVIDYYLHEKN